MPKDKASAKDKKKKKAKKKAMKKDEKPPAPIKWADAREPSHDVTADVMRKAAIEMNQSVFPQNIRQEQCNPGIMPNIIKEVYMPPQAPPEVATLIESTLVY